jgi:hypothetical protein
MNASMFDSEAYRYGVALAKVALCGELMAGCRLTSNVQSTNAWRNSFSVPETVVSHGLW